MAFDPFKAYQAGQDEEDRIERRRSEKAKAFREYVDAKVANGEQVDPLELDRMRMTMAGGDPYLASYIPAGDALNEMANRANEQSRLSKLKLGAESARQRGVERDYVQRIIDENWDKDETQMAEIFGAAFGQDGIRIYDQYKPELGGMISEATNKKYAMLSQNPAAKLVKDEDDLYRFFPAEMRNPKTAAILKTMAKDNQRQRRIDDVGVATDLMKNTPDFVLKNPEMQKWWGDFAGQAMPGGPAGYQTALSGMSVQMASEQQSKIIDLASKDPYFATATQTGDQEAIFSSIRSLMVQAGMPAPMSPNDPNYLAVKRDLDLISKTSAIATYNKREADLKVAATEEAEGIKKAAGKRAEALLAGMFPTSKYGNGKSGKDAAIDDRITMAMNMIGTDSTFFPSEENLQAAVQFIKTHYDNDRDNFDPAAVAGQFMADGMAETQSQWVDRRANTVLETEHQIKPGTNFTTWSSQRHTGLRQTMLDIFDKVSEPSKTPEEYDAVLQNKALAVQALRGELAKINSVVNTLNNDPSKRSTISNYDYHQSLQMMQTLENSLRALESFNPAPPVTQMMTPTQAAPMVNQSAPSAMGQYTPDQHQMQNMQLQRGTQPQQQSGDGSYQMNMNYHTNSPTRLDTYLDKLADAESSGDPFARAKTSSAKGLLQFTDPTWKAMVSKYGQQHGITEQDIYNPAAQRIMGAYLTMENAEQLIRQTGKEPTERDLYLAHFLGAGRASTVINAQGSQLLAANMFPDAAQANRDIFYKDGVPVTIEELYQRLGDKVTKRMNV